MLVVRPVPYRPVPGLDVVPSDHRLLASSDPSSRQDSLYISRHRPRASGPGQTSGQARRQVVRSGLSRQVSQLVRLCRLSGFRQAPDQTRPSGRAPYRHVRPSDRRNRQAPSPSAAAGRPGRRAPGASVLPALSSSRLFVRQACCRQVCQTSSSQYSRPTASQ